MDWCVVVQKQDPMTDLFTPFFLDCTANLVKQCCIILASNRGVLLHILTQQDSFGISEYCCQNLVRSMLGVGRNRSRRAWMLSLLALLFMVIVVDPQLISSHNASHKIFLGFLEVL